MSISIFILSLKGGIGDNYVGIQEENPIIKAIYEFSQLKIGIFLSDDLSLDSTTEYSNSWNHIDSKYVILVNKVFDSSNIIDRTIINVILNRNVNDYVKGFNVKRTNRIDIS
ncbi:hypothetical protein J5U22_01307 [Saccharolobus shibatae]|uniref:Uncharacterized protein n=1 Tax=Saccharolobus shibatae TaxID=2286 RepID=A0A8F5C0M0_9CREN|nr:hypothetical protein J5U22_01307 [Saccharolobus shibatae]